MGIVLSILGVLAAFALLMHVRQWKSSRASEWHDLPPLIIPMSADPLSRRTPTVASPPAEQTAHADARPAAPVVRPTSEAASMSHGNGSPPSEKLERVEKLEPINTSETIRFHRIADEPVQLLPGRLEVVSGDSRKQEIRFIRVPGRPVELILGREPGDSAQHVTLRSNTVSRQHARFAFQNGGWVVANLSHTNPVVVNDEALSVQNGARPLSDGDRVELGEVVLRFRAT